MTSDTICTVTTCVECRQLRGIFLSRGGPVSGFI